MAEWFFYPTQTPDIFSDELLGNISDVFADGFGIHQGWGIEEVRRAIKRSKALGVLYGESGAVNGYAFYSVPDSTLHGGYMLWEDAICVRKSFQGQRQSSRLLFEQVCAIFKGRRFDWIGGRTQNPLVFLRYSKLGTLFPFDHLYIGEEGDSVISFLIKNIEEVQEAGNKLDQATGICRSIYSEGKLGNYHVQVEGAERYEELLQRWGFKRENGDALVTVAKLTYPIYVSN